MTSKLTAATALLAIGLPFAIAQAQTAPAADPHHPQGQGTPAPPTGPSATTSPASPTGAAAPPMGMMMGDMQQMMQMMRQMMQMMGGGDTGGGPGGMMGGGMPMMGMMTGEAGAGSPGMGMGMGHGGPGGMAGQQGPAGMPAMFHHTEGVLAFYKAELRITDAQTPQWNGFAAAVRAGTKGMRDAMQRASAQPAAATAPELLDRRVALLASQYDAAKGVAATTKALYTVLTPEQRKLWDSFMTEHMRAMRGVMQ